MALSESEIAEDAVETETVHQSEAPRQQPAMAKAHSDQILDRHTGDAQGDEGLHQARRQVHYTGPGKGEGTAVRDREGHHHLDDLPEPRVHDEQREQKQNMDVADQDVLDPKHEYEGEACRPGINRRRLIYIERNLLRCSASPWAR